MSEVAAASSHTTASPRRAWRAHAMAMAAVLGWSAVFALVRMLRVDEGG
jgi:hypothetical protein